MLTPKNIRAKTAIEYFQKGYYQNGQWLGKGAEALGLKGEIKEFAAYENIIKGLSPDGSQKLFARSVDLDKRRVAVDCTFAAPKSVSLGALVGGDERLIQAHTTAVEKVLLLMEAEYAHTRVMLDGLTQSVVKTGNLAIAKYDHIETRELDPHLHSHCLVMNMTQLPDGEWYSHLNEGIFRDQKLLGMMYQHYLALEVQKLGYEIERRDHGQFEIKGYTSEQRMEFSKRRQQILATVGADATWQEREKAWKKTRRNKELVSPEELKTRWRSEAEALGITFIQPGSAHPELESPEVESKVFEDAIKHCSQKRVAFRASELAKFVLGHSTIAVDVSQIPPLIDNSNELIRIEDKKHGVRYTTQTAVRLELDTIRLMQQGLQVVKAIAHPEMVEHHLEQTKLNSGQRRAVMMTLTTTDQFVAWQGVAGAGKTFALNEFIAFAQAQGYVVKGFAPSAKAARVLEQETHSQTQTVARLLSSQLPQETEQNQIWVVDEAGLLSAKDAHALLERALAERARVILVGDTRQLSAVEAGNPFKSLQQAGIRTTYLNESQRQKDSPLLKNAVDLLAEGRVEDGFSRLVTNGSIQTVTEAQKLDRIVEDYLSLTPAQRSQTLLLAGTHEERRRITAALRKALQAEGSLGSDVKLTQLRAKNLSDVEKGYIGAFSIGDMVMPLRDYKRKQLTKGEVYEVVGKTLDKLQLEATDGNRLEIKLDFKKAVYEREEIEVAVGDRLMWKKNNQSLEQVNGEEVVVKAINGSFIEIEEHNGKSRTIDLSQPHHLDHAIVRTTYSSQGETASRVLIAADSTIGFESFYVAASRAKHELCFYTQNPKELLKWALESKAQENPLELLRQQMRELYKAESVAQSQQLKGRSAVVSSLSSSVAVPSTVAPPLKRTQVSDTSVVLRPIKRDEKPDVASVRPAPPIKKTPLPAEAFWTPGHVGDTPEHIEPKHWRELVEGSAIHPEIAAQNFRSLQYDLVEQAHEAWGYLFYSDKLTRSNTGRLSAGTLYRYKHIDAGGWWSNAGVDPRAFCDLQPGQKPAVKLWGSFKPNIPREDSQKPGKFIKYEHPLKTELSIFLLDVPKEMALSIYAQAGVNPTQSDTSSGFWYCVWKYNLPITITEGAKKAASLLSQGHAAIGLPGIYAGYRSKDEQGNEIKARLHEELAVFATPGRDIKICFDYETRPLPKRNLEIAISRTGSLLERLGARVSVISLPGPDKGVDDLIKAQGPLAYSQLDREALRLKEWREKNLEQPSAFEASKKLSVQPQKAQREPKLVQQQSLNHQFNHQFQEQANDFNTRQLQSIGATNSLDSRSSSHSSTPTETRELGRPHDQLRGQPYQFTTGAGQLFEAISGAVEFQETERLAGAIERLNRRLRESQFSVVGAESLRAAIAQFHAAVTTQLKQQSTRRLLNALTDYIEQSAVLSDPKLTIALETLSENLTKLQTSDKKSAVRQLDTALSNYTHSSAAPEVNFSSPERSPQQLTTPSHSTSLDKVGQPSYSKTSDANRYHPLQGCQRVSNEIEAPEHQPFLLPVREQLNWTAVRQYLVVERGLPEALVDKLHLQGSIYADSQQNAVFLRHDALGQATGAYLGGTLAPQESFKELAVGTQRDAGWFHFTWGEGKLTRVVLTNSPIDALSLAALELPKKKTVYISVDGAGSIPHEALQKFSNRGGRIEIAFDADEAGKEMASIVREQLPKAALITTKHGQDWNEQLLYYHQMWQHYNSTAQVADGAGKEYAVGKLAAQEGHNMKDVAMMLMRSPAVNQMLIQLGAAEARNYVGRTIDAVFEKEQPRELYQRRALTSELYL